MAYKVALGINYYDDPDGLIRILNEEDVYEFVEKIYVIDGRYAQRFDLPEHNPEILDDLNDIYSKVHLERMSGKRQIDKRNRYLELAEQDGMDFLIVVDSDEYIKINPIQFNGSLRTLENRPEQCFPIKQHMEGVTTYSRPRLFKAPFDFRHRENRSGNGISHGSLYDEYGEGDREIINEMYMWFKDHPKREINSDNQTGISGVEMWHDKTLRSRERVIADRVYYDEVKNR